MEINAKGIIHDKLVFCHCIVHQQSLCAKSVKFDHVVSVITDCINFIKKRDLKTAYSSKVLRALMLTMTTFFISVLFVGRVVGICLGAFILFFQKLSRLQI